MCDVGIESLHWSSPDYGLNICMTVNREQVCFPDREKAFDKKNGSMSFLFPVTCQNEYLYSFDWTLFETDESTGVISAFRGGDSQINYAYMNQPVRTSRPYFPEILFSINPNVSER